MKSTLPKKPICKSRMLETIFQYGCDREMIKLSTDAASIHSKLLVAVTAPINITRTSASTLVSNLFHKLRLYSTTFPVTQLTLRNEILKSKLQCVKPHTTGPNEVDEKQKSDEFYNMFVKLISKGSTYHLMTYKLNQDRHGSQNVIQ